MEREANLFACSELTALYKEQYGERLPILMPFKWRMACLMSFTN
ncbi:hypothetical protein [Lactiplantibacillus pentosus]|nr:hypothetical protein [Lactiplantibacillus pentosus]